MFSDFVWNTDPAVRSNLEHISLEQSILSEQRLLEISELADSALRLSREMLDEGFGIYEILTFISSGLDFGGRQVSDMALPENIALIRASLLSSDGVDRALFCERFAAGAEKLGVSLSESDFLKTYERPESFTYSRNAFADEAYDVFSQDFTDPRVVYSSGFKESVERVCSGDVAYCLLPLEEKGGARLPTVEELIFRNELKINSVTPVFGYDGNADLKYALISKSFTIPQRTADTDRYLEIRLDAEGIGHLSRLLIALELYGMSVYRINTTSYDTEGERRDYVSLVLRDGGRDFSSLLTYLVLFVPDHTAVGMYKNLE